MQYQIIMPFDSFGFNQIQNGLVPSDKARFAARFKRENVKLASFFEKPGGEVFSIDVTHQACQRFALAGSISPRISDLRERINLVRKYCCAMN